MNTTGTHALAGAYVLDALSADEIHAFEKHLASCPDCRADVLSMRESIADLSAMTTTAPPPQLRGRVLDAISGVRPLPPTVDDDAPDADGAAEAAVDRDDAGIDPPIDLAVKRRSRTTRLLAAVAAAVVAIGVVIWSPWSTPTDDAPQLTATEQVMQASDAEHYTQQVGDATVTVIRSASMGRAVLITENMENAPDGKDYQAWFDIDGTMVSAGVMPKSDSGGSTILLDGDAAKATQFAISLEPEGGSSSPTLDNVLTSFSLD